MVELRYNKLMPAITKKQVYQRLGKVQDPELGVDLVNLGLIYEVTVTEVDNNSQTRTKVHILMTLTTPGCPLAGMFDSLVKEAFTNVNGLDPETDITIELTFDPPWFQDMMSEEAKAELGF